MRLPLEFDCSSTANRRSQLERAAPVIPVEWITEHVRHIAIEP
jgi:hypothetical protein